MWHVIRQSGFALATVFAGSIPAAAQTLADGLSAEGTFVGTRDGTAVTFTSVYWEEYDRHSLSMGAIFGKPQFSIMASTVSDDGSAGRPILVFSIDPVAPSDQTAYQIGELRINDNLGRNRPLRAESGSALLTNLVVTADGMITFDATATLFRMEMNDDRKWDRIDDAAGIKISGQYVGQIEGVTLDAISQ